MRTGRMTLPSRYWRLLSAILLVVAIVSAAVFFAIPQAQVAAVRGSTAGYAPPVRGAEQLRLGVNTALEQYDDATLDARLEDLRRRGIVTVRQTFRWSDVERTHGSFDWTASDRLIAALHKRGMKTLAVLLSTPAWAHAPSSNPAAPPSDSAPPADAADFAVFVHAFAARYDPSPTRSDTQTYSPILAYQIWDEPNLSAAWGNAIVNPLGYLRLLRAASDAIHSANPLATVVLAGLAPTVEQSDVNLAPQQYLAALYDLGGADAFDVVAAKPYGFDNPPEDRRVDARVLNLSHVILMYETMVVKGDSRKAIWITQFGWNSLPTTWKGAPSLWGQVTESQQADYTARAVQRAAREWYWLGGMFVADLEQSAQPQDPHVGFGLLIDGKPRPVFAAVTDAVVIAKTAVRGQYFAPCTFTPSPTRPIAPVGCYHANPGAQFSEGWRYGDQGADPPQYQPVGDTPQLSDDPFVAFSFSGRSLAVEVHRGNYRANIFVVIDGKPANALQTEARGAYLPMWSPGLAPSTDLIEVANNLADGVHTAKLIVERGWNQWPLIGWSSSVHSPTGSGAAKRIAMLIGLVSLVGFLIVTPRAGWRVAIRALSGTKFVAAGILTAAVLWGAAFVSWAQEASFAFHNFGTPAAFVMSAMASALFIWAPVFTLSLVCLVVLFSIILMRLDIGLTLVAFFIPFYILPQRLFAYSFSMVELLILMCLAKGTLDGILHTLRQPLTRGSLGNWVRQPAFLLDAGVIALVLVAGASAIQADQRVQAFRELRMVIVEPAIMYCLLRIAPLTAIQRWRVMLAYIAGAVVIAGIGLFNYTSGVFFDAEFGIPRIRSVFGSPNNDALYLGRALAALAGLALARLTGATSKDTDSRAATGMSKRLLLAIALCGVPIALALVLSQSRGALLLGMPLALITVSFVAGGRWRQAAMVMVGLMVCVLLALTTGTVSRLLAGTRLANALDITQGTGFFRISLWQSALAMWLDHFWLGVGPDNFLYAYRSHYILPAAWQEPNLSHPHNFLMDFASRLGVFGLGTLVLLALGIGRAIGDALQQSAQVRATALGACGLVAYMVGHGLVDQSLFLVDLSFVFMLWAGLTASKPSANKPMRGASAT